MNGYDQIYIYCSSSKLPVILVRLKKNLNFLKRLSKTQISNFIKIRPEKGPPKNSNFLERLSKNTQISNFIKIRPVFHAEERTDRYAKLIVFFEILRTRLKS